MTGKEKFPLALAVIVLMIGTQSALHAAPAQADPSTATATASVPAVVKSTCMACHGMKGVSASGGSFPDLAGQWPSYLMQQLRDFKSHNRADPQAPIMWGMAAPLNDKQIAQVAQYFSTQQPADGHTNDAKLVAAGRKLYYGGLPSEQVPACMACHGATLAGVPPFFPMLAGQNEIYVKEQLEYFKTGKRANDPKGMMRYVASKLDETQIAEVAAFIRAQ